MNPHPATSNRVPREGGKVTLSSPPSTRRSSSGTTPVKGNLARNPSKGASRNSEPQKGLLRHQHGSQMGTPFQEALAPAMDCDFRSLRIDPKRIVNRGLFKP